MLAVNLHENSSEADESLIYWLQRCKCFILPLKNWDSFHSKSVFRLRFLNNLVKVYSRFIDFFWQRLRQSCSENRSKLSQKYFLYLDFFERYNYHPLVYLRQFVKTTLLLQKQPSRGILKKRCSEIMQQIYSNFIEITFWHGCSPVNLLYIFRTTFSKNTSGWLLLSVTNLN